MRSLREVKNTVANFRPSVNKNPPIAPTVLAAGTIAYNEVQLSWTDNSSDESGFMVKRTTVGGGSVEILKIIADLGPN